MNDADISKRVLSTFRTASVVAARYLVATGYFNLGDEILYGKYKNKRGIIRRLFKDEKGNPSVEIEPVPKGRKQNKILTLFKVWHADLEKRASDELASARRVVARFLEAKGTGRGWEHRKEKDDKAEMNIPPEYVLLWRKLKPKFKGTPDERAEQFMEYIEEHPGENDAWLQQNADKEMAKVQREWEKKRRETEKLEKECDKHQTKYEDAWYKEQERAHKEREKLKQLREKAEGTCEACPTCVPAEADKNDPGDAYEPPPSESDAGPYDDEIPF